MKEIVHITSDILPQPSKTCTSQRRQLVKTVASFIILGCCFLGRYQLGGSGTKADRCGIRPRQDWWSSKKSPSSPNQYTQCGWEGWVKIVRLATPPLIGSSKLYVSALSPHTLDLIGPSCGNLLWFPNFLRRRPVVMVRHWNQHFALRGKT